MSMTVKQLADSLGVTKTAIRKRFTDEFRANHLQTLENGVLVIDDDGCKLIAETLQSPTNYIPESMKTPSESVAETTTTAETALLETLQTTIEMMQQQLAAKDAQIAAKDEQLSMLGKSLQDTTAALSAAQDALQSTTAALTAAQALHAGTIQQQLTDRSGSSGEHSEDATVEEPKRNFWQRLFGKK